MNFMDDINCGDEILVYLKYKNSYILMHGPKDFWYMDYSIWNRNADDKHIITEFSFRFGIKILNEDNLNVFLKYASSYIIDDKTKLKLKKLEKEINSLNDFYSFLPSLLIDFDQKYLYSYYRDMISFENYVPETWTGLYEEFYDLIPDKEKYWTLEELTFFETKAD
ncbi:hypothetical protein [Bartonella sp. HY761]|uniref:hypothetical protein n=1 Tax=Bartonella sp. HY761 TaxID=2979330 RepID=UPI0021E31BF5|nr:hypothetical protein [Bartonella sp. HY761]UXN08057.1 hypothetical protein N6A79_14880 [Bartonella sp. HY761]